MSFTAIGRRADAAAMLYLSKELVSFLHAASPLHRLLSTSTSPIRFAIEDYLVATCHLTPAQALKASKYLSHLKSPSNPDAVLAFLSGLGLSPADISAIVAADPRLLSSRVDKTLAPRLVGLRGLGLSAAQVARFVSVGAFAFRSCDIAPKLAFWIPFFGSFDRLLQAVKKNNSILMARLDIVVKPNIALLQKCGLGVCDIAKLCIPAPRLLVSKLEKLKAVVLRAEKLGVPRGSAMFKYALVTAACISQVKITRRLELLKGALGCSEAQVCIAVCKQPTILRFSEEKLRRTTELLVTEVGLEPGYIVNRPALLAYSLEKRLLPRHYVVKVLQAKGLLEKDVCFYSVAAVTDKKFISRYISKHKQDIPGLADAYAAVCVGKMPAESNCNNSERRS